MLASSMEEASALEEEGRRFEQLRLLKDMRTQKLLFVSQQRRKIQQQKQAAQDLPDSPELGAEILQRVMSLSNQVKKQQSKERTRRQVPQSESLEACRVEESLQRL
jgi:hypothetical protein